MSDRIQIQDDIEELIHHISGMPREQLNSKTRIRADVNIVGLDVEELLHGYFNRFDVNTSHFAYTNYFDIDGWDEGLDVLRPFSHALILLFFPSKRTLLKRSRAQEREITVEHLVRCAVSKIWSHPDDSLERTFSITGFLIFSLITFTSWLTWLFILIVGLGFLLDSTTASLPLFGLLMSGGASWIAVCSLVSNWGWINQKIEGARLVERI